jgi:phosphatidylethanolamine-binding protein
MQFKNLAHVALLAGLASAQTPAGFVPKVEAKLDVIFGTKAVATPGTALTKAGMKCGRTTVVAGV